MTTELGHRKQNNNMYLSGLSNRSAAYHIYPNVGAADSDSRSLYHRRRARLRTVVTVRAQKALTLRDILNKTMNDMESLPNIFFVFRKCVTW